MKPYFVSGTNKIPTPVFFPDATRAVIRTLDSKDIEASKTLGLLVNTFHLYTDLGRKILKNFGGIGKFMDWKGGIISDSGGFQVMSLVKQHGGKVTDEGVFFNLSKKKRISLTPEQSIDFQLRLKTDMVVVLDDFTPPSAELQEARDTVERTILWAKRCRIEFDKQSAKLKQKPYLLGVVQGGKHQDLRKECCQRLVEIGFDGYGYGGWPVLPEGGFDYLSAQTIVDNTPKDSFLYGLGIGKPDEVVNLVKMGYDIFDCVLPTRDARHKRLYVFTAKDIDSIDLNAEKFFSYFSPDKEKHYNDKEPVSYACDCLLCANYSKAYLHHLFKIGDSSAFRLATIHNLRFYSLLMERLRR